MQTINVRNQLHLCWREVVVFFLSLIFLSHSSFAQNNPSDNLIHYDNQWVHYGFLIGLHSSKFVTKYSDTFTTPAMDSVHSIVPGNLAGFKLGFVINMRIVKNLDFRILPTVGFYENDLLYRYTDLSDLRVLKDATMVELPMLLKYKSERRGNLAMYLLGGVNPSFEASGKGDEADGEVLELKNWNISVDVGVGLDMYYTFFKFSPEIRYSYGLRNMLATPGNELSVGLSNLTTQNLGLFITFEGGPDNGGKRGKKTKGAGPLTSKKRKRKKI